MAKKIAEHKANIVKALKAAGKYSKGLDMQVLSLASALRTLDLASDEIDELEITTIPITTKSGGEGLMEHPVFKTQKNAMDAVTRQMKALGLTAEELTGQDDNDPLIDLTKKVQKASRRKTNIIKPDKD